MNRGVVPPHYIQLDTPRYSSTRVDEYGVNIDRESVFSAKCYKQHLTLSRSLIIHRSSMRGIPTLAESRAREAAPMPIYPLGMVAPILDGARFSLSINAKWGVLDTFGLQLGFNTSHGGFSGTLPADFENSPRNHGSVLSLFDWTS